MDRERDPRPVSRDLTPSLVIRLRAGDESAGRLLDQLYREKLRQFCRGYLASPEEIDDVVQDVFCRVLESPAVPDNFRAWTYRIARNRCLDVQRSRRRKRDDQPLPEQSLPAPEISGNLTKLVRREQHSHLQKIFATLPFEQREVLRLRYADDLSRSEIAEILEIPESVVKSRLYEGLEKLRSHSSLMDER